MKQMVYTSSRKTDVLAEGRFKDYHYCIVSYGTHPCAYIELPETHKYYGMDYDNIDINCHGGLTYSYNKLKAINSQNEYWIGWDYAHYGDYYGCGDYYNSNRQKNAKKWRTEEIFKEVRDVINQLKQTE